MKKENRTDLVRLRKIIDFELSYHHLSTEEKFRLFKLTFDEFEKRIIGLSQGFNGYRPFILV